MLTGTRKWLSFFRYFDPYSTLGAKPRLEALRVLMRTSHFRFFFKKRNTMKFKTMKIKQ